MKKILALTLSLLLIVLLLPTAALAGENDVARNETTGVEYASLKDAMGDANDGDTITLLKGFELPNGYDTTHVRKSITLDLNGFTMILKYPISVQSGATFTIQNEKDTGGITVAEYGAFVANSGTTVNLTGVTITGTNKHDLLFEAWSGSTYNLKNCNITWQDTCIGFIGIKTINFTIENTTMDLTGTKNGVSMTSSAGRLEIINSTITGEAAKLFITPDTNNKVDRPSVSIASDAPQSGIIDYSYDVYKGYNSGKFILPGISDAGAKLKALLKDSFRSATLLVPCPDGLYLSSSALEYLGDAKNGETYTIEQAGNQEQMEELAKAGTVPANGCIIVNGTTDIITVNEVEIQPGQSHTFTEKGPEIDPPETNITVRLPEEEPAPANPTTGAVTVAVCVAKVAVAALG